MLTAQGLVATLQTGEVASARSSEPRDHTLSSSTEEATKLDSADPSPVPWGIGTGMLAVLFFWLQGFLLFHLFVSMGMETGGYALRVLIGLAIVPPTVILLARKRWGASLADLGIIRPSRETLLWAARVALVLGALWLAFGLVLVILLRGRYDIMHYHIIHQRSLHARDGIYWAGFATLISAPITEELLHRGLLYRPLRDRLGPRWAILMSAVVFTALHVSNWGRPELQYGYGGAKVEHLRGGGKVKHPQI